MKKVLATILSLAMFSSLAACSTTTPTTTAAGSTTAGTTTAGTTAAGTTAATTTGAAGNVKIGFIALHDTNSGYDAAHIEGVTKAAEDLGLDPKTQIIYKYNIP